jgi:hypothetical protein
VALQADGKVLVAGDFIALQPNGAASPTNRLRFARLLNDPATQSISVLSPFEVIWNRSGTGPEVSRVTFETSFDGGASWFPAGTPVRFGNTTNWRHTGLSIGTSGGLLRARGRGRLDFQGIRAGFCRYTVHACSISAAVSERNVSASRGPRAPLRASPTRR